MTFLSLTAANLIIPAHLQNNLRPDGALQVPATETGFVAYGPYTRVEAGLYQVNVVVSADPSDAVVGRFDIFDSGLVIFDQEISHGITAEVDLPKMSSVEFRFRAQGKAFTIEKIELTLISASKDRLKSQFSGSNFSANPDEQIRSSLWRALHSKAPAGAVGRLRDALSLPAIEAVENTHQQIILCWNDQTRKDAVEALKAAGLDASAVIRASIDTLDEEAVMAREAGLTDLADRLEALPETVHESFEHPFLQGLAVQEGGVQFTTLMSGVALCPCPYTGEILASSHAIPVAVDAVKQTYVFYRFDSISTFYLVVAGFGGRKTFIYIPDLELTIQLSDPGYDWGPHNLAVVTFKILMLKYAKAFSRYISQPTRPALLQATINNLGHFIWNDSAGLLRFSTLGLLSEVKHALIYKYAFLDPLSVMDGAPWIERHKATVADDLVQATFEHQLLPVRPTAMVIEPVVADKIVTEARRSLGKAAVLNQVEDCSPVVWFNLRGHNKVWLEQADCAVRIGQRAVSEGKRLALYLDGMPDCADMVNDIRMRLPEGVRVVDGTQVSMLESIVWADRCDAYVATIGSGLTVVTWLTAKQGVAHSERAHLPQIGFWPEVRPDAPVPEVPPADLVIDEGVGAYCNYHIDPELIVSMLWDKLEMVNKSLVEAN